jgi:hypothetical protein
LRNFRLEVLTKFLIQKKKQRNIEEQDKEETRHFVNVGRIDRSVEEWEIE